MNRLGSGYINRLGSGFINRLGSGSINKLGSGSINKLGSGSINKLGSGSMNKLRSGSGTSPDVESSHTALIQSGRAAHRSGFGSTPGSFGWHQSDTDVIWLGQSQKVALNTTLRQKVALNTTLRQPLVQSIIPSHQVSLPINLHKLAPRP